MKCNTKACLKTAFFLKCPGAINTLLPQLCFNAESALSSFDHDHGPRACKTITEVLKGLVIICSNQLDFLVVDFLIISYLSYKNAKMPLSYACLDFCDGKVSASYFLTICYRFKSSINLIVTLHNYRLYIKDGHDGIVIMTPIG